VARRILRVAVGALGVWLALAYGILPAVWSHYEHHRGLEQSPRITRTADGAPGDPLNVGLVATDAELRAAMARAGWRVAAALGLRSDVEIAGSVVLDRPDPTAPVSDLFLFGRKQDVAFEKEAGESAKQRHHVRFWRWDAQGVGGRPLWIGSATFDRGVGLSHRTGQVTHHIAPDVDADRDMLLASLEAVGQLEREYLVTGLGYTLWGRNGGGDRYFTDGELAVGVVPPGNVEQTRPPEVSDLPPTVAMKQWLFSGLRPLLD
jgi:predicted outer membrane lipoprotein